MWSGVDPAQVLGFRRLKPARARVESEGTAGEEGQAWAWWRRGRPAPSPWGSNSVRYQHCPLGKAQTPQLADSVDLGGASDLFLLVPRHR